MLPEDLVQDLKLLFPVGRPAMVEIMAQVVIILMLPVSLFIVRCVLQHSCQHLFFLSHVAPPEILLLFLFLTDERYHSVSDLFLILGISFEPFFKYTLLVTYALC